MAWFWGSGEAPDDPSILPRDIQAVYEDPYRVLGVRRTCNPAPYCYRRSRTVDGGRRCLGGQSSRRLFLTMPELRADGLARIDDHINHPTDQYP
jgi:hypothetical protein